MLEPSVKSLHLAEVIAMQKCYSKDVFDKKYVEKLISYHLEKGLEGPAIYRQATNS